MTDNETICRSCGKIISHVTIDRKANFKSSQHDLCLFRISLNGMKVSLPIPNSAICRNCGDIDFIAECIHCPECDHYPFAHDIQIFDDGVDMTIAASTVPLDDEDAIEEIRTKKCANCGKEIPFGSKYLIVGDNFLQVRYFDSDADNVFCSDECLKEALTVMTVINGEEH